MEIGVVGQGFVGSALSEGMRHAYNVFSYDKYKESTENSIEDLVKKSDCIFVCVPTPMRSNGKCDISIVESVVMELDDAFLRHRKKGGIVVIKSTVPPGTTAYLNSKTELVEVAFNPEFLREKTALQDFINQDRIVLGSESEDVLDKLEMIYSMAYPDVPILRLGTSEAEMVKYTTNCFLATKVIFANNLYDLCNSMNVDYEKMINAAMYDDRLGNSHWGVPGHDGSRGFGGHCFPKDLNALIYEAKQNGAEVPLMEKVWEENLRIRPSMERDWENMVGRAVVND
jgi:UDPglucose 6-dehydrogenase